MNRIERKRRWIVRRRLDGWRINEIAETLQVSEKTVDRWLGSIESMGGRAYASDPEHRASTGRHLRRPFD